MIGNGPRSRLRRSERLTLALAVVYLATLAVVVAVGELVVWLLWAVAMVAITGYVLVAFNRASPPGSDAASESDSSDEPESAGPPQR